MQKRARSKRVKNASVAGKTRPTIVCVSAYLRFVIPPPKTFQNFEVSPNLRIFDDIYEF
ncbi:MAG TPA: hypothetical protein PKE69_07195 [Pyrinomonadaceae bacterium]|nr:hypothetical protein [Pyrinomonadaceae bacterium]